MENQYLSIDDIDVILESLKYSKLRIEEYQTYPSYEYKQQRLTMISDVVEKLRNLKKALAR